MPDPTRPPILPELIGLPALTLTPPYGTAIMRWRKYWENRDWPPPEKLFNDGSVPEPRLGIHQGQVPILRNGKISKADRGREIMEAFDNIVGSGLLDDLKDEHGRPLTPEMAWRQVLADAGKLIGTVRVVDYVRVPVAPTRGERAPSQLKKGLAYDLSPWMMPGQLAWHTVNPQVFAEGIRLDGLQKIWKVNHDRLPRRAA